MCWPHFSWLFSLLPSLTPLYHPSILTDADRLAVAVQNEGTWAILTGNEAAIIFAWWLWKQDRLRNPDTTPGEGAAVYSVHNSLESCGRNGGGGRGGTVRWLADHTLGPHASATNKATHT